MRDPDEFDAFYKDARERLLAQTYALTGDLGASRRAVRDAFVAAWHHWRKVAQVERAEDVVRPHAWRLAQRRHTARVWHREKDISDSVRATLDALGRLSPTQRRVLVLTQLAAVSMEQMAREVALPLERVERELQSAVSSLSLSLDLEAVGLRTAFEELASSVAGRGRWPRSTIVRRSGAARRRTHTVAGVAGAVVALVVSGSLVTDASGVRPTLEAPVVRSAPEAEPSPEPEEEADPTIPPMVLTLPETTLLGVDDLGATFGGRRWTQVRTGDNSSGAGMALPCQRERYADPRGEATLVRFFEGAGEGRPATAVQLTEASRNQRAARRTFRTVASWLAACDEPRAQLMATRAPVSVGDESVQVVIRRWAEPLTTYVVGVARTGEFTTTTAVLLPGSAVPDREAGAALLASAVRGLCDEDGGGACAPRDPRLTDLEPMPTGQRPALLSEIDLPPVTGVSKPWVGTMPERPTTNPAATGCDTTSFDGSFQDARFTRASTRTFLVPEARLPREFGLSETVGALPPQRAQALVDQVRSRLADCPAQDLNTEVVELVRRDDDRGSLTAWRLDVRVSDERSVVFYMAFMRTGTGLAQLGFVPAPEATLADGAFVELAERARARLGQLPPPA